VEDVLDQDTTLRDKVCQLSQLIVECR